mmetsp:Transcript_24982/g.58209  ORF Transcript_24982/g.58209 Transcript_24982/m.58209 type:complete len:86 (-) Transcript_24982:67-324(-)
MYPVAFGWTLQEPCFGALCFGCAKEVSSTLGGSGGNGEGGAGEGAGEGFDITLEWGYVLGEWERKQRRQPRTQEAWLSTRSAAHK